MFHTKTTVTGVALRLAMAAALMLFALPAAAHDTWFAPLPSAPGQEVLLALGTGNQFPVQEFPVGAQFLQRSGCRSAEGVAAPLTPLRADPAALVASAPAGSSTCWAQLAPFDVDLTPALIPLYLDEVRPPQAVLDAWAAIRARGLPWKERFTKHARIELAPGTATAPTGMDMDVLLNRGEQAMQVGAPLAFQLLRDGLPLADFNVELRYERSRVGIWLKTNGEGRVRYAPPLAGLWALRAIDLRLSPSSPDTWDSRFVTLVFRVAAQKGSSLNSNNLSASHTPASNAISSEPPAKIARW